MCVCHFYPLSNALSLGHSSWTPTPQQHRWFSCIIQEFPVYLSFLLPKASLFQQSAFPIMLGNHCISTSGLPVLRNSAFYGFVETKKVQGALEIRVLFLSLNWLLQLHYGIEVKSRHISGDDVDDSNNVGDAEVSRVKMVGYKETRYFKQLQQRRLNPEQVIFSNLLVRANI